MAPDDVVSAVWIAAHLGVSVKTVRRWFRGENVKVPLPGFKPPGGRAWRTTRRELDEWLREGNRPEE